MYEQVKQYMVPWPYRYAIHSNETEERIRTNLRLFWYPSFAQRVLE